MGRYSFRTLLLAFGLGTLGCASYRGSAHEIDNRDVTREPGWVRVDGVPVVRQSGPRDCGAAALSSVLKFWGKDVTPAQIRADTRLEGAGLKAGDLRDFTRQQGLTAFVFYGSFDDIRRELSNGRPVIVGTAKPYSNGKALTHYEVVVGYNLERRLMLTMDPARGWSENTLVGFLKEWIPTGRVTLVVLSVSPGTGAVSDRR